MIILGIDPGLACTGYGLIKVKSQKSKVKNYRVIDYGCIYTLPSDNQSKRLKKIFQEIKKIIKNYKPDKIVLEKIFFAKNVKTALKIGEVRGVILLAIDEKKISLEEITPLQVKMALTGYGRASKKQIQKMVQFLLKLKKTPKPDDAADALAIAICGVKLENKK